MTTLLLIRHATTDAIGKFVAGRQPGVQLNRQGVAEAAKLVERLSTTPIRAVYSSPLERTRQTAEPLCRELKLPNEIKEEFNEIDFGEWTGKTFEQLDALPEWRRFNRLRSVAQIPGGESMLQVTTRMVNTLETLRGKHGDTTIAIFSHGDPIRAAIAYFTGMPIDFLQRIEVSPASISVVDLQDSNVQVFTVNDTGRFSASGPQS